MNRKMILYILGVVLLIEAALMLLPLLCAILYREAEDAGWFLLVMGLTALAGLLLQRLKPENTVFYLKEGCIATALSWVVMSLFGALPFALSGQIPSYVDALFETVSGFTTTGASILPNVEALSHAMLFWRSFTHWIGGMGILVFLLAIISMSGGSHMNLMRAESPGPTVGKLVPKVRRTAAILYVIYTGITLSMILILVVAGMPLFDAVCSAFGTAGTGGFGIKADSFAGYAPHLQWIVGIYMAAFGVNFNAYYYLTLRRFKAAFGMEEVRWFLGIILCATALISVNIRSFFPTPGETLRHAFFQVSSIITTTGFATTDFDTWPIFSKATLVTLMFIGACAGSTGGGLKVSRVIVAVKCVRNELSFYIHPKRVRRPRLEGKLIDDSTQRSILVYFLLFFLVFVLSLLLVSLDGLSLTTNFTAVAATLNNIGPGLDLVGPSRNFAQYSDFAKLVLMFDMLAGRLELFPMVLLFYPPVWKRFAEKQ